MRSFLLAVSMLGPVASPAAVPPIQATPADASASYYFLLGRHLESVGKIDEAVAALRKGMTIEPKWAELPAELAALYARQDKGREALEAAETALKLDPDNREANRIQGTVYAALSEQGRPFRAGDDPKQYGPRAIAALEKSRRDAGLDLNLELTLGRLYLKASNFDKAILSLKRVVDDQPGYPEAAMLLAAAQEGAGRNADEIATLETSLQENPTFFRGLVRLAELYEGQRRFPDAADLYKKAQASNPRADLAGREAAALINAGQFAEAADLLQSALARKPAGDANLLYMLAQAQRQNKDAAGAAATVQRLTSSFPDDARGMYVSAQLLQDQGRTAEAITAFEALMKKSPDEASLVYEYANLLQKSGRAADAERALRDLLKRDPLDAVALNSLGYMFAERGEHLDEAVDLLQRALKVEPANPSYLDSLGWAYFRQGKLDQADASLSEAAAKLPESSAVQDHLGDLRLKQQRFADAAVAFERSLAGDGESIDRARVETKLRDARGRLKK